MVKNDRTTNIKKILEDSYQYILAPLLTFLVRKVVGITITFSNPGNVEAIVKLIFG